MVKSSVMLWRIFAFVCVFGLILLACTEDSVTPELTGVLSGTITVDGQGTDGVIIDVSAFHVSGGHGLGKIAESAQVSQAGDYSIELNTGTYRADYTYYGFNNEVLTSARYPIIIAPDITTTVDVEMKDPIPHSFLVMDGNASVELSWESSYDAINYRLYRSDSNNTNFQLIAHVDTSAGTIYHTDQPPTVGTYYYYVTAMYGEGSESRYEEVKEVEFTASIRPPTGLEAIDLVEYIRLNWDDSERAFYYRIYRSKEGYENWAIVDSTSENYSDDIPPDTAIYNYRLTAVSIYGTESEPGTVISVNYDGRFDPPQGLTIVDKGSDLYISWLEYDNVSYYSIYRTADPDNDYQPLQTTTNPYYSDSPADSGVFYYYVTATAPNGLESEPSVIVSSHYDGVLEYPSGFVAFDRGLTVELGWEEILWAGAYLIFRSDDSEIYVEIARVGGAATSYNDVPVYAGLYYYRIATETIIGTRGELSEPVSVLFTDNLLAPTGIDAENLGTSINITWNVLDDADGYKLYRARTENGSFEYIDSTSETSYMDIPPVSGAYYYKVSAYDIMGHESPLSNSAYVHFDDSPLPPHNITVVDSIYKLHVWWESIETIADFMIYRSSSMDTNYAHIQTTDNQWAFDWPPVAGHYFYKIRTVVDYDTSDFSGFSHVLFSGILHPPTDLVAFDAGTHIRLEWNSPPGATYFEVYRGNSIDGDYTRIMTVYENSADDAPESAGIFFYKVRAFTQGDLPSPFTGPVQVEFEP
ncbi:MAG: hypothetical protein GY839_05280 [candidate division Zixibacteria bacterium]|nr:hypothetical protein [candidate division Zixibacteria bacterium]